MSRFLLLPAAILLVVNVSVPQADVIRVPSQQPTIQAGIDTAINGDTVLVADGSYTGVGNRDIDFLGKAIVVMSENGPDRTTINCEGSEQEYHRGFYFHSDEDSTSVLRGFTIQYGYHYEAAGIFCENSSPKIKGNVIRWNDSIARGGGIHCFISSPIIDANIILGNESGGVGAGVICSEGSGRITRNLIRWNVATSFGGGILLASSSVHVLNNSILNNTAQAGGGIYCGGSFPFPPFVVEGNLIKGNNADRHGGGIYCSDVLHEIIKGNTIVDNYVDQFLGSGGGIFCEAASPNISNCIIWGNIPDAIYPHSMAITYSDVDTELSGEGTINIDPLFRDPASTDYHLMSTKCGGSQDSPCIDAGIPTESDIILDCQHGLGTERCDMGAYGGLGGPTVSIREPNNPEVIPIPKTFSLFQNYPNPFNPTTTIAFDVPSTSRIKQRIQLIVYNLRGKQVIRLVDSEYDAGTHHVIWDGRNEQDQQVSSGVYLYTLKCGEKIYTRKMVVVQ